MKEWFKSSELVGLIGMPNSVHAISNKAKRNKWLRRKAAGQGSSLEYHISYFHEDTQKILYEKYATLLDHEHYGEHFNNDIAEMLQDSAASYMDTHELLPVNYDEKEAEPEKSNVSKIVPLSDYEDWARLPVYDVHAAAGAGTLVQSEFQIGIFSIPVALLHEYGLKENYCSVIFVDGNSMHPTVSDKDRVLVDIREVQHPAKDGVYVIRIDDAVYIKRLHWNIAKGIYNVISDNPKHESFEINHNNGRNFKIIGKVVTTVMKAVV
ncbi:helix-turn-helix domain-containing protein [Vibrio lentus]|uniref:helix-turn-helix domain-containing protein n=1 Tax=Vibrio lentus TaxID=136468 RepID=UPI000C81A86F|nr:S24 family peptidase [Vibrio lentus]PMM25598.1 repressor [Vibrio lentus]